MSYEELKQVLLHHGQDHVLQFYDKLDEDEKASLLYEVSQLNIAEVNELYERATESLEAAGSKVDDSIEPITYESLKNFEFDDVEKLWDIGLEEISLNKVGVVLLAGGQGTRLGFDSPKGMFNVGLPSNKTLFQIQAERIQKLQNLAKEKYGKLGIISWYIMTSVHTSGATRQFFKENNYFGLKEENVILFEQGSLPCFDFNGKLLLDQRNHISTAPDGNGGLYRALKESQIIKDFIKRGIKHLHAHSVDNILIKVADPVFIGYCQMRNYNCAVKVVNKTSPHEAVGVVCKVDGVYRVVEYSEITPKTAELTNETGELQFNSGNICNHYFSASFLEKVSQYDSKLKLHVAKKKIPYVDNAGMGHKPLDPNGIKIEKFIFDVFEFADTVGVLQVERDVEFSALKNADSAGKDCPSTARSDLFNLHKMYIIKAGGIIPPGVNVEISPLLSYAGENLEKYVEGVEFKDEIVHLKSECEQ